MANGSRTLQRRQQETIGHWKVSPHYRSAQPRQKTCHLWYDTVRHMRQSSTCIARTGATKEHKKIKERSNAALSLLITELNGFCCIIEVFWTRNFVSSPALQRGSNWAALSNIPLAVWYSRAHYKTLHIFLYVSYRSLQIKIIRYYTALSQDFNFTV